MDLSLDDSEIIEVTLKSGNIVPIHYSVLHRCQLKYQLSFPEINLLCSTDCWILTKCDPTLYDVEYIITFQATSIEVIKLVMEISSPDFELFKPRYEAVSFNDNDEFEFKSASTLGTEYAPISGELPNCPDDDY